MDLLFLNLLDVCMNETTIKFFLNVHVDAIILFRVQYPLDSAFVHSAHLFLKIMATLNMNVLSYFDHIMIKYRGAHKV